jgi:hypothetical protein
MLRVSTRHRIIAAAAQGVAAAYAPDGQPATDVCEAVEDGGLERNRAHWDDLMPDRNEQEAEAPTISNNGF